MVLKINNNLITPSHIIEGEKVNDTYFDGKYHLMLPNSEERYLTSISERKQLLNESLRSNLYDRKTRGTIVNNTTSGNMFEIKHIDTLISGFSDNNYLTINNLFDNNTTSFDIIFKIKQTSYVDNAGLLDGDTSKNGQNIRLTVTSTGYLRLRINSSLSSGSYKVDITGNIKHNLNDAFFAKASFSSSNGYTLYSSSDGIQWTQEANSTEKSAPLYNQQSKWFIGDNIASGFSLAGFIFFNETKIYINNTLCFDGSTATEGIDYDIVGNLKIEYNKIIEQKPFNQSVTINSSEIQEGTKYLVDYPGMFQIKTEDNTLAVKFLFEDEPVWKYIKQEELVEGDNVLSLVSDTEKLKFIVNTTEHILVNTLIGEEMPELTAGYLGYREGWKI